MQPEPAPAFGARIAALPIVDPLIGAGKWREIKYELHRTWTRLSFRELEQTKGDPARIRSLIAEKYGAIDGGVQSRLDQIVADLRRELKEEERIERLVREKSKWRYRPF